MRTRITQVIWALLISLLLIGCTEKNDKKDKEKLTYQNFINEQFDQLVQKVPESERGIFDILKQNLSPEEQEAMKFLYVSMPLSDLANRPAAFYLEQVRTALKTRQAFKWGKNIPEDVFRHFVLPYRINNEDSDSSRSVFFKELSPRIKDLNIEAAALEVNHWCHEKVNYRPTNSRTMSPLGVIKTAYGRCGEESTFTVTALRSVGIPARQVYTPRWAHTDDNHAWVEVYIDGQWKYLGACEPKAVLNTAWFDEPVLRAMMVHTKAFGKYKGSEDVIDAYNQYSILNLLSNYVPVKTLTVKVVDSEQKPIAKANISFGLYNYAEFYPLKKSQSDANGEAQLTSGLGTLEIMASNAEGLFNSKMVNLSQTDTCWIVLDKKIGQNYKETLSHIPPVQKLPKLISSDKIKENERRLLQEDSIREAYISSFYTNETAQKKIKDWKIKEPKEAAELAKILVEARGNYKAVENYMDEAISINPEYAIQLLSAIESKDLHDMKAEVLLGHLKAFRLHKAQYPKEIIQKYILNPRVILEEISDYRAFLQAQFDPIIDSKGSPKEVVEAIKKWVEDNITIDNKWNYYHIALSPKGTYRFKTADKKSRDLFVVTLMRSLGFPARIEQARSQLQYYDQKWIDLHLKSKKNAASEKKKDKPVQQASQTAQLSFTFKGFNKLKDPLYRIHFGLSKYNGSYFETLEYDWEKPLSQFPKTLNVEPGYYQLITGNRLHDGRVLIHRSYFNIKDKEHITQEIILSEEEHILPKIARWESFSPQNSKEKYEIIGWIDPKTEPGKHFINDFKPLMQQYIKEAIPFKLYTASESDKKLVKDLLPKDFAIDIDQENKQLNDLFTQAQFEKPIMLPVFIIIDQDKNIRLLTKGYNIGTPQQLLKYADLLKKEQ